MYVPSERSCAWEELGDNWGAFIAPYQKAKLRTEPGQNKIHCQECGRVATKARGGFVLTRSTIVCGKCYDEAKHGACSSREQRGPANDPATCRHERRDKQRGRRYCLDCWAEL